jgi:hypothetical protein
MSDNRIKFALMMLDAVQQSESIRKKIVDLLNREKPSVVEGIVAMVILAAGHAKETGLNREGFLLMCERVYDSTTIAREDFISGPLARWSRNN